MALGRHLVAELELADSNDTLGRWLAHEVAGVILLAETTKSPEEKSRAVRDAARLITTIWRHRAALPGHANPLARYRRLTETLDMLRPENVQRWFAASRVEKQLTRVTDAYWRLLAAVLISRLPPDSPAPDITSASVQALTEDEQSLLRQIVAWITAAVANDAKVDLEMFHLELTLEEEASAPAEDVTGVPDAVPGEGPGLRAPKSFVLTDQTVVDSATAACDTSSSEAPGPPAAVASGVDHLNATIVSLIDALQVQLTTLRGAFVPEMKGPAA